MTNNERFAQRAKTTKIVWTIIALISTIIFVRLWILNNDLSVDTDYTGVLIVLLYWEVICGTFCLCSLVGVKFHSYKYKNHEISLYLGFSCGYLLIDGQIVDKHTGSFINATPMQAVLGEEVVSLKVGYLTFNKYSLISLWSNL